MWSITEQNNLLALNPVIEVTQARKQCRGFVVADEVRALASRTQQSTAEIDDMALRLQNRMQETAHATTCSGEQMRQGVEQMAHAGDVLEKIATGCAAPQL